MRRVIDSEPLPTLKGRFSQGMAAGPLIFLAGQIASDFQTGLHADVQTVPALPASKIPIKAQTQFILERQQRVALAASSSLDRTAQVWTLLPDLSELPLALRTASPFFAASPPAKSTFGVERLTVAGARIEIDAILAAPDAEREVIPFADAHPGERDVAAAVRVGPYIFVSSLAAMGPTGQAAGAQAASAFPYFVSTVKEQTRFILRRLERILAQAGSSLNDVVKVQIFMPNLHHFAEFEEVWQDAFPDNPPARSIIPAKLSAPQCVIEINTIAVIPGGGVKKEIVSSARAPVPCIHEPHAVKAGPLVFLSQLMATDYKTGKPDTARVNPNFPNHESEVRRQLGYIFQNADAILQEAGSSLKQTVKRQGFYTTFANNLGPARDVTLSAFSPDPSPSTTVSLGTSLLVPGCIYMLDAIAIEG
jgi:enamine deaminase RidA (YjgF/YER057c/UK114 family)